MTPLSRIKPRKPQTIAVSTEEIGQLMRAIARLDEKFEEWREQLDERIDKLEEDLDAHRDETRQAQSDIRDWFLAKTTLLEEADRRLNERDKRHSDGITRATEAASDAVATGEQEVTRMNGLIDQHRKETAQLIDQHRKETAKLIAEHHQKVKSTRKNTALAAGSITAPIAVVAFEVLQQLDVFVKLLELLAGGG